MRVIADKSHGFPCRISLGDAQVGEEVILTHHEHHKVDSSFRSSDAIYVWEDERHFAEVAVVPQMLRSRLLSLRAFDQDGMLLDADGVDGLEVETLIERLFIDPAVAYIHAHFAKPVCYAALIEGV